MLPLQRIMQIDLGLVKIPSWGVMIALAICIAGYISYKESKRLKLDPIIWRNSSLLLLVFGMLGMRLFRFFRTFNFVSIEDTIYDLFVRIAIDSVGGIVGVIAVILYLKSKKVKIGDYIDSYALAGAALIIFARFGCLLVLDEIGTITSVPWAVFYSDGLRHPVALYYILNGLGLFILISTLICKKISPYPGFLINVFFIVFPIVRGFLEFFREEPPEIFFGLDILQIAYFSLGIVSIIIMFRNRRHLRTLSSYDNPR